MTGKMVVTNNGGCNTVGKGRRGVDGKEEQNLAVIKLVDLVAQHSCLPIVVCRSTCDDLDSLCSFLSALPFFSSSTLVSLKLIFFRNHPSTLPNTTLEIVPTLKTTNWYEIISKRK